MKGYEIWSNHGDIEERTDDQEGDSYEKQINAEDAIMDDVEITSISPDHEVHQANQVHSPRSMQDMIHDEQQDGVSQMLRECKENCEDQKLYNMFA
jgi:hypothetical protein